MHSFDNDYIYRMTPSSCEPESYMAQVSDGRRRLRNLESPVFSTELSLTRD